MTYGAYPFPVSATLLDVATGETRLPLSWPMTTTYRDGVIDTAESGVLAHRETRQRSHSNGRVVQIQTDPADAAAFELVLTAIDVSRGGAGLIEWRHPDDSPAAAPSLWRSLRPSFDAPRPTPHMTRLTLTLEEAF